MERQKRLSLKERFNRLTLWNKLAVMGSLASMVAIPLAVLLYIASHKEPQRESLIKILEQRATYNLTRMDAIIYAFDASPDKHQRSAGVVQTLKTYRTTFLDLHHKYIGAIRASDIGLAHEIHGQIYDIIHAFNETVEAEYSNTIKAWYDALPCKYITAPEPGVDPLYDEVSAAANDLYNSTVLQSKALAYPGIPP
jgi:hypothetical protein